MQNLSGVPGVLQLLLGGQATSLATFSLINIVGRGKLFKGQGCEYWEALKTDSISQSPKG